MKWCSFITGSNMQIPWISGLLSHVTLCRDHELVVFHHTLHSAETMNRWSFITSSTVQRPWIMVHIPYGWSFTTLHCAETMNHGPYTLWVVFHYVTLCRDHESVVLHHRFPNTETMNRWSFITSSTGQRPWIGGLLSQVPNTETMNWWSFVVGSTIQIMNRSKLACLDMWLDREMLSASHTDVRKSQTKTEHANKGIKLLYYPNLQELHTHAAKHM